MSNTDPKSQLVMPISVVSKLDVSRLVSEVELIDNQLTTAAVRVKTGLSTSDALDLSPKLNDFLTANNLAIGDGPQRSRLINLLRQIKEKAPVIHMTFAASADQESLGQLVEWLRQSVHPLAVIAVGLQPNLVGGVYVRTPNQVHDLSLRARLAGHRDLLVKEVEALNGSL